MRTCLGLTLLVAGVACTPSIPADPPDSTALPDPEPAPPEPSVEDAPHEPPPDAPRPALPAHFAALGRSCAEVDDQVSAQCDEDGKAVGLSAPVDLVHDIPWDDVEIIHDETGRERGGELRVGFSGQRLWVRHVSCGICRRVIGFAIVADLDRLSDEQLQRIQDETGLATEPVLRTREDWQRALAPP